MKFVSIDIKNKYCKGIYLFTNLDSITDAKQVKPADYYKFEIRTRVKGKLAKRIVEVRNKSFIKALEYVSTLKDEFRDDIEQYGTIRNKKKIELISLSPDKKTFLELAKEYIDYKTPNWKASTITNNKNALLIRSTALHNKFIEDVTLQDIQTFVNKMSINFKPNTVNGAIGSLRSFLTYNDSKISWKKLKRPTAEKIHYNFELEDTKKIIAGMRDYSKMIVNGEVYYQYLEIKNVFLFLLNGRRISEVLSLTFDRVTNSTYTVTADRSKINRTLTFDLTSELKEVIVQQRNISKDNKLFHFAQNTIRRHFYSLLKALNYPRIRIHDIRHMIASTLLQNGTVIADISVMLGHQSVQTTERIYSTTAKEQATRAVQALDALVKPNNDTEMQNKLNKLKILLPEKSDEELMALLEIFLKNFV
jgi:integrase